VNPIEWRHRRHYTTKPGYSGGYNEAVEEVEQYFDQTELTIIDLTAGDLSLDVEIGNEKETDITPQENSPQLHLHTDAESINLLSSGPYATKIEEEIDDTTYTIFIEHFYEPPAQEILDLKQQLEG